MQYRELGRTGWKVSALSFGAWAIGSAWGQVDDKESLAALHKSIEMGVNFFDTADVYGDGLSERLVAELRKESREKIYIATKAGRRLDPHTAKGYNRENLTAFVEPKFERIWRPIRSTCCNCTVLPRQPITGPISTASSMTWLLRVNCDFTA